MCLARAKIKTKKTKIANYDGYTTQVGCDLSLGQYIIFLFAREMTYFETAVFAALLKTSRTFDLLKIFGEILTRDLWHAGR